MDIGFSYLVEKLGIVNAERFVATIKREKFDYTKWRREYFGDKSVEEINSEAITYIQNHPHKGRNTQN